MKMTYGTPFTFNQWTTQPFITSSPVDLGFPRRSISMRKPNKVHCEASLNSSSKWALESKWNLLQRAAAAALDAAEGAVARYELQRGLPKFADPEVQIAGNFAPVPEQPVRRNLPVVGDIPECINGVYVRNGANPLFQPLAGHHVFDGDGMVHAVTINGNAVSYSCRFTETSRLVQERERGRPVFFRPIGELHGYPGLARLLLFYARGLFGLVDIRRGTGLANAGLVYFNRRLLAMSEDDLPYHIRVKPSGDLETVGRYDFDGNLTRSMIAHPKLDPESGELFALSYHVARKPYLKYFKVSPTGKKSPDVEIPIDVPTMTHDFAITENHVIIPDQQLVFRIQGMVSGGSPVNYDKKKKSRFGILKKTAKTAEDITWVESPDTCSLHLWNAWEEPENQEIVVICSCMTPPDSIFNESKEDLKITLTEIRLNQTTGESRKREIISETEQINLEVGMVNRNRVGRKSQYAYLAIAEPWPKVLGFAKVDLESGELKKYLYGEGRYGGEPFFMPRKEEGDKEDEGYLLSFVHDEKTWESELQIVDGVSLELQATVKLPSRVPYGFHGTFITAKDLQTQA